jgi:hypothetical protein
MGEGTRVVDFDPMTQKAPASYGEGFEVRELSFGFYF